MRVLVAVDFSPSSEATLREVARRPWPAHSVFRVLHVVDSFGFTRAPVSLLEEAKDAAKQLVKRAAGRLSTAGLEADCEVILGNPRTQIVAHALEWDADWIVVGSHGASKTARALFGSTARAVVRRAPCSVEVVRTGSCENQKDMRVLLGTDGSECSQVATRSIAARSWPPRTEFRVVSVSELPIVVDGWPYFNPELMGSLQQTYAAEAKEAVDNALKLLRDAGIKATSSLPLPMESVPHMLFEEAKQWGADVLVVGSHGRRGFDRLMMGSVSEAVALSAPCSVEVIREKIRPKS